MLTEPSRLGRDSPEIMDICTREQCRLVWPFGVGTPGTVKGAGTSGFLISCHYLVPKSTYRTAIKLRALDLESYSLLTACACNLSFS